VFGNLQLNHTPTARAPQLKYSSREIILILDKTNPPHYNHNGTDRRVNAGVMVLETVCCAVLYVTKKKEDMTYDDWMTWLNRIKAE
jgi:hypothetical protein